MSAALLCIAPGPHVTVQDAGRRGWRRFGVAVSGAMDFPALAAANVLVGNPPETPTLEFAQIGGIWEVAAESCRIAVTGGDFVLALDTLPLAPWRSHTLRRGQRLVVKGARDAVWGYIAVAQGFDVPLQLGSCATHLRSGLGGRRIAEGDALALHAERAPDGPERQLAVPALDTGPLRIVLGPQDDFFAADTIDEFLATPWQVSRRGDRMGTWLEGPSIPHAYGYNVLSDGSVPGCIQVPGSGQPVVLLMDCQTIGGFPKLATIISSDLPRFAQCRAGKAVRFAAIEMEAAQSLYRRHRADVAALGKAVEAVAPRSAQPFWLRA